MEHFLSLDHVCEAVFRSTSADLILLYCEILTHTPASSDSLILEMSLLTYLLTLMTQSCVGLQAERRVVEAVWLLIC